MKRLLILIAAAVPAFAQQSFDFKSLEKLGANAKESTNISLEGDNLKLAAGLLGDDKDTAFVKNLNSVHVHSYEFEKEGQYNPADLAPVRAYVRSLNWPKILDVKEDGELTEIYGRIPHNNEPGGFAIIAAESKEVTIIFISGTLTLSDLGKLKNLGVPDMTVTHGGKKSEDTKKD
jgi:hypothetical protein